MVQNMMILMTHLKSLKKANEKPKPKNKNSVKIKSNVISISKKDNE